MGDLFGEVFLSLLNFNLIRLLFCILFLSFVETICSLLPTRWRLIVKRIANQIARGGSVDVVLVLFSMGNGKKNTH